MSKFGVILAAAGQSRRFSDKHYKKPFAPIGDRAVWLHAAEHFASRDDVCQTIVVIAQEDQESFHIKYGANLAFMGIDVAIGGQERSDSVAAALQKLGNEAEYVAVHDAARPCVEDSSIDKVFEAAASSGAALLACRVSATLKREASDVKNQIAETVSRQGLWTASTPQVFERSLLEKAYQQRGEFQPTDDAQLVERLGHAVTLIEDSPLNIKITTRRDLKLAELIIKSAPPKPSKGGAHPFADDDLWR